MTFTMHENPYKSISTAAKRLRTQLVPIGCEE